MAGNKRTVVFDMDGVLFDTESLCMDGWNHVAKKCHISGMDHVARQCIGLNSNDTRHLVLQHYGQDFPYDDLRRKVSEWVWSYIERNGLPMKPGVYKILSFLEKEGFSIGLASSTKYSSVMSHLKQAAIVDYFSVIVAGDMIEHSKPQPDIYLLACRKLGINPQEAFAIEDSPNGIRAAYDAGMKAVMVPDLIEPDEEMEEKSYLICSDLMEVMRYFASFDK